MNDENAKQIWDDAANEFKPPLDGEETAQPAAEPVEAADAGQIAAETGTPWYVSEPAAPAVAADDEPVEPAKPGWFKRVLHFLFGADTKVGRFMRPLLRKIAMVVIAATIGVLAAYFVFHRPLQQQYNARVAEMQALAGQLDDAKLSIGTLEGEKAVLQSNLETEQAEHERANYRVNFLTVKNDVLRARLALADQSNGPGGPTALAALNELDAHLEDLLPYVEGDDPVLADLLSSRLAVVQSELVRNATQAKTELESFYANLLELEDTLFE
jgi:hypothetical protein